MYSASTTANSTQAEDLRSDDDFLFASRQLAIRFDDLQRGLAVIGGVAVGTTCVGRRDFVLLTLPSECRNLLLLDSSRLVLWYSCCITRTAKANYATSINLLRKMFTSIIRLLNLLFASFVFAAQPFPRSVSSFFVRLAHPLKGESPSLGLLVDNCFG